MVEKALAKEISFEVDKINDRYNHITRFNGRLNHRIQLSIISVMKLTLTSSARKLERYS